jgi:TonB family protein
MLGLLVSRVNPEYPSEAKDRHVEGDVLLKINIDKEGNVYRVEPESGDPQPSASAAEAAKQWKYRPFLLNGQAVEVETKLKVNFTLAP